MIARTAAAIVALLSAAAAVHAQTPAEARSANAPAAAVASETAAPAGVPLPPDYVVGPEDVLSIVFWHEKDMSGDAVVRPDGRISLLLLNDVEVAGLTPEQVRERIAADAKKFIEDPAPTVIVKQINSRKVYITGNVERPGTFPLLRPTTVLQLIALAGGLKEFAKASDITVVRGEGANQMSYTFNYDDVKGRKNLAQNIVLKPGDTVIVP